jgi:hypothetical protein
MVQWTGHVENYYSKEGGRSYYLQYVAWPDGDNHLTGALGTKTYDGFGVPYNLTHLIHRCHRATSEMHFGIVSE